MANSKKYRIIGIIIASIAVGAFLFFIIGGQRTEDTNSEVGQEVEGESYAWQQYADEPTTFDWYVNYSWFNHSWGENIVSQKITEETGVSINFITPSGNESEKINALIASNSLPDFITLGWWESQINEMIEGDMVYALNELADEYDMYFWEVSDPEVVKWYTQEDGNIYCYPNSSCSAADVEKYEVSSNQVFLVRKDIYEAIGSPDMTTPEGFKAAVEKAAEMFPEVDGEPLIPVGAHEFTEQGNVSFDNYLMNFLAVPFEENGEIYDRYTNEDYITWLKMFRELGEEGLLANDIFIDQRTQTEEKMAKGRYFCMLYQYTDMVDQQKELYANYPERIYMAVDGPKNAARDDHTLTTTGINGWTVTLISKNCEHPERAIAFLNYMLSEHGQIRIYLGIEGETFDYVDGSPVIKEEVKELLNTNRAEYDKLYGADDTYWMLQDNIMQSKWQQEKPEYLAQLEEWTKPYAVYNGQYDSFLPLESEEAYLDTKISTLWSETLPKLLMADSEEAFDEIFADFLETREAYGYEELKQARNELMQQAKEKLGID
ncbi:MAG: extracellular solute-binding protein [Lachnospiraceae bacterium]|nr:extracellular solute-binding protein [Lachnospiraceae bacterium]